MSTKLVAIQYGSVTLASKCNPLLISYSSLWSPANKTYCVVSNEVELEEVPVATEGVDLETYSTALQRIYEFNPKHNQNAALGSPLPVGMTDVVMQKLLDEAIWSDSGRRLCAHSSTFGLWIVFHQHGKNRFHGFPEEFNRLSIKGFDTSRIPSL